MQFALCNLLGFLYWLFLCLAVAYSSNILIAVGSLLHTFAMVSWQMFHGVSDFGNNRFLQDHGVFVMIIVKLFCASNISGFVRWPLDDTAVSQVQIFTYPNQPLKDPVVQWFYCELQVPSGH